MLNSIVGPAVKGVADFASAKADKKSSGSDSFGKVLEEKNFSKAPKDPVDLKGLRSPKDKEALGPNRAADSPKQARDISLSRESERRKPEEKATVKEPRGKDDTGPEKSVKGKSQREQAILKFMDSFESEFGVPPTRIVEAMANLPQTEKAQSPEETADQVIDQLGLDDDDKDPAKGMYIGLLAQLGQLEKPQPLQPKPELSLLGSGSQGRFEEVQAQKGALNQSLQSMNENFFMNGAGYSAQTASSKISQGQSEVSQDLTNSAQDFGAGNDLQSQIEANPNFKIDPSKLNPQMQKALQDVKDANPNASPEVALAALVAAARAQKAQATGEAAEGEDTDSLTPGMATETGATKATEFGKAEAAQAKPAGDGLAAYGDAASKRNAGSQFSQQGQQQGETGLGAKSAKGEVAAKDKTAKSLDFDSTLRMDGIAPTPLKDLGSPAAAAVGGATAANFAGAAGKADAPADIRQIMNQAQYLIKKGGGEMKVEMTPEGMGKIHMKVLVENGKVNVQMSAETSEAKKVIEGGLSELKNSLAAHQLSVDHIKVDVVNNTNTDNTAQNQLNQNHQGRDQNRQFWNNFSENFGSPSQQRESFTDIPNMRGYARPRTDAPLEPVRSARVASYGASAKGKGLNLVA